jgi:hypothetical protein
MACLCKTDLPLFAFAFGEHKGLSRPREMSKTPKQQNEATHTTNDTNKITSMHPAAQRTSKHTNRTQQCKPRASALCSKDTMQREYKSDASRNQSQVVKAELASVATSSPADFCEYGALTALGARHRSFKIDREPGSPPISALPLSDAADEGAGKTPAASAGHLGGVGGCILTSCENAQPDLRKRRPCPCL